MERNPNAVIYTRLSADFDGNSASLTTQEKDARAMCESRGWAVVAHHSDEISARRNVTRPGWEAVKALVEAGRVDVIVTRHVDRITRKPRDLEGLIDYAERYGVSIATVTGVLDLETSQGRMVARILGAVAAQESDLKGERQSRANQHRAISGKRGLGKRPFGLSEDGASLVEDEAEAIREGAAALLRGETITSVAEAWSAVSGRKWTRTGVRTLLTHPRLIGRRIYQGEVVSATQHPAILDDDTFLAIHEHLTNKDRAHIKPQRGGQIENVLSGIAVCANCGGRISAMNLYRGERVIPVYRCDGDHCFTVDRHQVDKMARIHVAYKLAKAESERPKAIVVPDIEPLRTRLTEAATSYANGKVTLAQFEIVSGILQGQIAEAEALEAQSRAAQPDPVLEPFGLLEATEAMFYLEGLTVMEQRQVLVSATERIELRPLKRGYNELRPLEAENVTFVSATFPDGITLPDRGPFEPLPPKRAYNRKTS